MKSGLLEGVLLKGAQLGEAPVFVGGYVFGGEGYGGGGAAEHCGSVGGGGGKREGIKEESGGKWDGCYDVGVELGWVM